MNKAETYNWDHRDGITLHDTFMLPVACSLRWISAWGRDRGIGPGYVYIGHIPAKHRDGGHETEDVLAMAVSCDVHHIAVTREQARALAKVLMHYAKTGEVKNNQ